MSFPRRPLKIFPVCSVGRSDNLFYLSQNSLVQNEFSASAISQKVAGEDEVFFPSHIFDHDHWSELSKNPPLKNAYILISFGKELLDRGELLAEAEKYGWKRAVLIDRPLRFVNYQHLENLKPEAKIFVVANKNFDLIETLESWCSVVSEVSVMFLDSRLPSSPFFNEKEREMWLLWLEQKNLKGVSIAQLSFVVDSTEGPRPKLDTSLSYLGGDKAESLFLFLFSWLYRLLSIKILTDRLKRHSSHIFHFVRWRLVEPINAHFKIKILPFILVFWRWRIVEMARRYSINCYWKIWVPLRHFLVWKITIPIYRGSAYFFKDIVLFNVAQFLRWHLPSMVSWVWVYLINFIRWTVIERSAVFVKLILIPKVTWPFKKIYWFCEYHYRKRLRGDWE